MEKKKIKDAKIFFFSFHTQKGTIKILSRRSTNAWWEQRAEIWAAKREITEEEIRSGDSLSLSLPLSLSLSLVLSLSVGKDERPLYVYKVFACQHLPSSPIKGLFLEGRRGRQTKKRQICQVQRLFYTKAHQQKNLFPVLSCGVIAGPFLAKPWNF